jgi:hypothetical protein
MDHGRQGGEKMFESIRIPKLTKRRFKRSIHEYMFAIAEEIFTTLVAGLDPPTCDVRLFLE